MTSSRVVTGTFPGSQYGIGFAGDSLYVQDPLQRRLNNVRAAQTMRAAGVRFARVATYWYDLQQFGDNTFTPWALDPVKEQVQVLIDAGITPYITLQATACFAISATFPCFGTNNPPDTEAHWEAWRTYVRQMTQEFPQVHYWGIWNEPNADFLIANGGGDRLAAYKRLVELAAPEIRAAGGLVIGPDLGDSDDTNNGLSPRQWLASFLSTHGHYVDIVAVHLYGDLTSSQLASAMSGYAEVLDAYYYLYGRELWLTETAIGAINNVNANDADQARNLATVYRTMNSRVVPRWTKTFYHNAGVFAGPPNDWGIVRDLGTTSQVPRPAYDTLRATARPIELVEIDGPSSHRPNQTCEFVAQVFDPDVVQPISYTWAAAGAGGGAQYFYPNSTGITSSYVVSLTVRDPTGRTGTVQRTVKVGTQYLPCPE